MKTIGLIGGMSWESTVTYYQILNTEIKKHLGGYHSAKCLLYSVDFHEIEQCQSSGDWDKSTKLLGTACRNLQNAGADFILICTNTMHKKAADIQTYITIPLIHIAEVTALELEKNHIKKVALLGTKYTMKEDFYKQKLIEKNIQVLIPEDEDMDFINETIFKELCMGIVNPNSQKRFLSIMEKLGEKGAEGIILGCTEIGMLIQQKDIHIPLFDTTLIHAKAAALLALTDQ